MTTHPDVSVSRKPIAHPNAWYATQLGTKDDYSLDLEPVHLAELKDALYGVLKRDLTLSQINRDTFVLPKLGKLIATAVDEVVTGRGLVLIRGFPIDEYAMDELELIYWGFGTYIGQGESQSVMGDRVGHVIDTSDQDPNARAYRNRQELSLHTDLCDMIGMLSVTSAKRGGVSRYASAITCYNELLSRDPGALEILFKGFQMYRVGEQGPGELPYTPYRVPIFSRCEGFLSFRYIRAYIHAAASLLEEPLNDAEIAALDLLDEIAASPELMLEIALQPGEMSLINNYTVMHARSAFENGTPSSEQRHLLRLWLALERPRPVVPEINLFETAGIAYQEGQRPSGEGELLRSLANINR